jgi:PBSX family phage terminase large subunit
MIDPFAAKQLEFIVDANAKYNLAHGSVRAGKTVCSVFRFAQDALKCPDSKIFIVGHNFDSAYRNIIRLMMEAPELSLFRPLLTWSGKKLYLKDKTITVLGAKDEGAIGNFQGDTYSLVYCDEMTLYPQSIIEMIKSRLSKPYSKLFAAMNPKHPTHICKEWIDEAAKGNPDYYALHFTMDDNPFLPQNYKDDIRNSSGLFYKRNYLGLWCLAEGAIFDFFDKDIYVVERPPAAAEYWIAGIDYGTTNPFACLLIGVNTGIKTQTGRQMWVEKEYYWDPKFKGRSKVSNEFADDVQAFLEPYAVKQIYIDPSAAEFKLQLARRGMHTVDADNDVFNGIIKLTSEMQRGTLLICSECKNTIREIESYVWDAREAKRGYDEPLKENDHAVDALRYAIHTHKVSVYDPYKDVERNKQWLEGKYQVTRNR